MSNNEGEFFNNFDSLPDYKKRLIRRNQRRREIERKMCDDPNYKPKHYNAKISFKDCEEIRERFYKIPVDENFRKNRADFVKEVEDKYGIKRVTLWKIIMKKTRLTDTDMPSMNEIKDEKEKP